MARTLKQTKTVTGSTSNSQWTWKHIIYEYFDDDYITTNRSSIVVESYLGRTSSTSYFGGSASCNITCDGTNRSSSKTFSYPTYVNGGGWLLVQSESFNVTHNSDGTKSISISSSMSTGDFIPNSASASGSITLTTIPRASKVTCPSFNIGDSTVINIERYSTSFRHTVKYSFGSLSGTISTRTASTSVGWTPNADDFYKQIISSKSKTGTITCETYSGTTLIGTSTCSFTAYAKEARPDVSVSVVDTNETTIALTGDSSKIVLYASKPKFTINAVAKNYATISSYKLSINDGQTSNKKETIFENGISSAIYIAEATDSRGFNDGVATTAPFVPYIKCSFTKKTIGRVESASSEILVDLAGNYFNDNFGVSDNTISLKYRTREKNGTWSNYKTVSVTLKDNAFSYAGSLGTGFDIEKEYEVEFIVNDKLTSDIYSQIIEKGLGVVEIGEDLVNVNGDLTVRDNPTLWFSMEEFWNELQVLRNLFGLNKKISWEEIACKNSSDKGVTLDEYLKKIEKTTIYEGSLLAGSSITLSNVKRFLDVYFCFAFSSSRENMRYTIDTSLATTTYSSGVMVASDESSGKDYYVSESSFDKSTKKFTHVRAGFFQLANSSYTSRTGNASYRVYRIDTYD